jgi:RNA polymerase sigma-70 factor (ECF subfamily)
MVAGGPLTRRVRLVSSQRFVDEPVRVVEPQPLRADFSTVYDTWFRSVYRWVTALGGPQAEVEDLTQEVFVVVQRQLERFDGRNLAGWLYTITARTVSDHRRRRWFRSIFLRPRDVELDELEAADASSEQQLQQKQDQQRFYRYVARMNAKWRDAFVLFEIEGYSGEEIATLLSIPPATVRTHLHRARKEFLALVEKERS